MKTLKETFPKAEKFWDLERLYTNLAKAKRKPLTPIEKTHLCGLLCGYSPTEIAEKLYKDVGGVNVNLSNTIYQYVKDAVGKSDKRIDNWRNIVLWLEEAGYKKSLPIPTIPVDAIFDIKNMNIVVNEKDIVIDVNIQLTLPLESILKSNED